MAAFSVAAAAAGSVASLGSVASSSSSSIRGKQNARVLGTGARRVSSSRPSAARVVRVAADASTVVPGMGPEMKASIDKFLGDNTVVVFMKGNKEGPKCGFSNTVVQIFKSMEVPFETVDILSDDNMRSGMKIYSNWPTFPQVYVGGEFYGGCDIIIDGYKDGTLKEAVDVALMS
mmetsp:Transcript_18945/g.47240  ORF Transcript_18945/g.47240 Transcript_18945/m.47240 type:complete len:175 (+) Transcript_18945:84-608(+)|eukprot:CAMPEP_0197590620 /NCGR_PEP_ID=MMETSP1326-20131121/11655_1 /TAXON_ID=1155430 /ORGANISM="Genus nov. species nov., Strain RCC2288" /LENGTH=174 /DNA_ID=CAMNT_0043155757 /DNA_START=69 /DNA_END=593 /DNA_ORIENTATION=+